MQVIKPTKKQVFDGLRADGCCWLGGSGCHCYSRQLKACYESKEKQLTYTEYTDEEIAQQQAEHEQAMQEMQKVLDEFWK